MEIQDIWNSYQAGITYKNQINLYDTVARNERFFVGDQWKGSPSVDLPKPVVNFIKRACQQKTASILTNKTAVLFSAPNWPGKVVTPDLIDQNQKNIALLNSPDKPDDFQNPFLLNEAEANKLNGMFEMDWNRMKMDDLSDEGLLDACISGDMIVFSYWDDGAEIGQTAKGQMQAVLIDNVNYYPGNVNERNPQKQPYIIIAMREMLADVKAEAKKNKIKPTDIEAITQDKDYQHQSGDMSQTELENGDGKIITLIYFYKNPETGTVWARKICKNSDIRKNWDTKLKRYPIAIMNWEIRKNSCHGRAEITGLIPNQVAINKSVAYTILNVLLNSHPKVIYNKNYISKWDNSFSSAIGVNAPVTDVAKYLMPPSMATDAYNLPATLLKNSLEMMGYNNASLGNVNPTNANAILAAIAQSKVPTKTIQNRYYNFVGEFALNWLDMTTAMYNGSRWAQVIDNDGNIYPVDFDPEKIKGKVWSVNIKIGAARDWAQDTMFQMLSSMANSGHFDTVEYLKMLPNEAFNGRKDEILASIAQSQQMAQQQQMMLKQGAPQMGGGQVG